MKKEDCAISIQSVTDNEEEFMDQPAPVLRQALITLPIFHAEVPVVTVEDGTMYIPVIALCHMLGLRAETHIPRWRRLVLWTNARKLPFRTSKGARRVVWCLHLGAFPLLCSCFSWQQVSPERRAQLYQAADTWKELLDQAHQKMLVDYRTTRHLLFELLTIIVDRDSAVKERLRGVRSRLDQAACLQLDILIEQGCAYMLEATAHARAMIYTLGDMPIVDAWTVDQHGQMSETFSLPLVPVIPEQDRTRFYSHLKLLAQWYQDVDAFLRAHGM